MSGLASGRGKVVGLTATAAVLLSTVAGGGAAQAAARPDPFRVDVAPQTAADRVAASVAAAEHIPSVCTIKSYAPSKIVLGATKVTQTFSVKTTGCTVDQWAVAALPFVDDVPASKTGVAGNFWYLDTNAAGKEVKVQLTPKISLSPAHLSNSYAGKLVEATQVVAWGQEDPADTDELVVDPAEAWLPLTLQRRSTFGTTFNASPEPVKKGKAITIKATLARINWNGAKSLKYIGFGGKAELQFKADGATKYVKVKTVTATSKGKISTTVKASKSGRWRLVFAGLSTTAPATSGSDAVKVK